MPVQTTILYEDAQVRVVREYDDVARTETVRQEWKPGSEQFNAEQLRVKLSAARQTFRDNFAQWPTLTNVQKDTANRQAQRALANLIGRVLDDLSDPGA